jgi:hypothetical protein
MGQHFHLIGVVDQKKAEGRGQRAEGIYPDAFITSLLATQREQGHQAPTELCSVARLQEGFQSPTDANLLPTAVTPSAFSKCLSYLFLPQNALVPLLQ